MDVFAQRGDPDSWVQINSSFTGQIVSEDNEYVILSNNGVEVRVKKSDVTEIDNVDEHWRNPDNQYIVRKKYIDGPGCKAERRQYLKK